MFLHLIRFATKSNAYFQIGFDIELIVKKMEVKNT